jgi:predicted DNA binding CopG/RHH family protein
VKALRLTEEQLRAIQQRAVARGATVRSNEIARNGESVRSKYGNRKVVVDGIRFDSQREADRWQELKLMQAAGEISELERQVRFPLRVKGQEICCYIADATYRKDGKLVVDESKGVRTREYIIKRKLMFALYGIEILET